VAINGIAIKVLKKNGKKEEKEIGDGREKRARDNAIVIPESPCDKLSVVIKNDLAIFIRQVRHDWLVKRALSKTVER